jgi:hypothetical protein
MVSKSEVPTDERVELDQAARWGEVKPRVCEQHSFLSELHVLLSSKPILTARERPRKAAVLRAVMAVLLSKQ